MNIKILEMETHTLSAIQASLFYHKLSRATADLTLIQTEHFLQLKDDLPCLQANIWSPKVKGGWQICSALLWYGWQSPDSRKQSFSVVNQKGHRVPKNSAFLGMLKWYVRIISPRALTQCSSTQGKEEGSMSVPQWSRWLQLLQRHSNPGLVLPQKKTQKPKQQES